VICKPTWEAAELLLANPDFKTYVDSYENADTSSGTQLNAQPEDQEIDNPTKQGMMVVLSTLKICETRRKAKTSETRQSLSQTLSIPKQTFHPPGNVRSECEMWTSSSQDLIKTQRVNPKSLDT